MNGNINVMESDNSFKILHPYAGFASISEATPRSFLDQENCRGALNSQSKERILIILGWNRHVFWAKQHQGRYNSFTVFVHLNIVAWLCKFCTEVNACIWNSNTLWKCLKLQDARIAIGSAFDCSFPFF